YRSNHESAHSRSRQVFSNSNSACISLSVTVLRIGLIVGRNLCNLFPFPFLKVLQGIEIRLFWITKQPTVRNSDKSVNPRLEHILQPLRLNEVIICLIASELNVNVA